MSITAFAARPNAAMPPFHHVGSECVAGRLSGLSLRLSLPTPGISCNASERRSELDDFRGRLGSVTFCIRCSLPALVPLGVNPKAP